MKCCYCGSREGIVQGTGVSHWFSDLSQSLAMSSRELSPTVSLPLYLKPEDLPGAALPLVAELRPSWSTDKLSFKKFTDGITNTLMGCYMQGDTSDMILIRIYGQNTDLLIDRDAEKANFKLLSAAGYAPKLYAVFINGLAYEYVHGEVLTKSNVALESVYPLVATMMAKMHSLANPNSKINSPVLWERIEKYISLIPSTFHQDLQNKFVKYFPGGKSSLTDEMHCLRNALQGEDSPVVFCHNDLLLANVVLGNNNVTFIDYEYAGYNYQAFDIGNHFAEFAGVTDVDYSLYPDKQCQMKWLQVYLDQFKHQQHATTDVQTLYRQVNKFALASHLLWAAWALVQAHHSNIDFDYISYANIRMKEYHSKKDIFLAL